MPTWPASADESGLVDSRRPRGEGRQDRGPEIPVQDGFLTSQPADGGQAEAQVGYGSYRTDLGHDDLSGGIKFGEASTGPRAFTRVRKSFQWHPNWHQRKTGRTSRGRSPSSSVVARAGIEPATFHFSGGRSYRLSYLASNERPDPPPPTARGLDPADVWRP